jgi:hypothetical protein
MTLSAAIIANIQACGYSLDLRNQNLTDDDIPELLEWLTKLPRITTLDLRQNKIGPKGARLLAVNTTLTSLRLKEGNNLSVQDLQPFLQNFTLCDFPIIGGSGAALTTLRQHYKNNANRPKQTAVFKQE